MSAHFEQRRDQRTPGRHAATGEAGAVTRRTVPLGELGVAAAAGLGVGSIGLAVYRGGKVFRTRRPWRLLVSGLLALAIVLVGSTPARAVIVPGDPNDPPPTPTPGSAQYCLENTWGQITTSASSVTVGSSVTVTWSVSTESTCNVVVNIDGPGFTINAQQSHYGSYTMPVYDSGTWRLSVLVKGNNRGQLGEATVTVHAGPVVQITNSGQRALFLDAIGRDNTYVSIDGGVSLDLSGLESIRIRPGVQIIGDRSGVGPLLFTTTSPRTLFLIGDGDANGGYNGDNVRISGVRIRGAMSDDPFSGLGPGDPSGIGVTSSINVEIDHNDISHFAGSGVEVHDPRDRINRDNADSVWIHDNYIHHNQHPAGDNCVTAVVTGDHHAGGYGVDVGGKAYALIERNVFDYNRHAIAAGDGLEGTGYLAYRNLILPGGGVHLRCVQPSSILGFFINPFIAWPKLILDTFVNGIYYTHAIDVHGQQTCGHFDGDHNCGIAGEYFDVEYNSILYTNGNGVHLRGTPMIGMDVKNNVFAHSNQQGGFDNPGALVQNATGMRIADNRFGLNLSGERRSCDFDGDGTQDSFMATGATWWYASSRLNGRWVYMNQSTKKVNEVSLGDLNSDGRCDVYIGADRYYANSDTGLWTDKPGPTGGSAIAAARSNGKVTLVGGLGPASYRRVQDTANGPGYGSWSQFDKYGMTSVAAEANADGRIEVVGIMSDSTIWHRRQTDVDTDTWTPWEKFDGLLGSVAVARNLDGRLEVFGSGTNGTVWHRAQTAPNAVTWTAWTQLTGAPAQVAQVAAEANADGRIELFGRTTGNTVFHSVQTTRNGPTWTAWSPFDGAAVTSIAVARNSDGRLEVFGTSEGGYATYHRWESGPASDSWNLWATFNGGATLNQLAAEPNAAGLIEVFGLDNNTGRIFHRWQIAGANGAWSGFVPLDGPLRPDGVRPVPFVLGMTPTAATTALSKAGYTARLIPASDCSQAYNSVLFQDPPSGPAVILRNGPVVSTVDIIAITEQTVCQS